MSGTFVDSITKEDTIYRDEIGFDDSFRVNINFSKVEFIEALNVSEASSIFHIKYCGEPRVLKVFHNNGDPGYALDHIRDLDRSRCEIRAYCSLKKFKICDNGFVPNFYGFMLDIDPASCAPHLDVFQDDMGLPCAILIEYLPKPLLMNCVTYTKERMQKAIIGIQQVHLALVEHNDPYPKNVLIVPGNPQTHQGLSNLGSFTKVQDGQGENVRPSNGPRSSPAGITPHTGNQSDNGPERVVWIDFDVAIVYPDNTYIGKKGHERIQFETEVVESFGWMLVRFPKQLVTSFLHSIEADKLYRNKIRKMASHQIPSSIRNITAHGDREPEPLQFTEAASHCLLRPTFQDTKVLEE